MKGDQRPIRLPFVCRENCYRGQMPLPPCYWLLSEPRAKAKNLARTSPGSQEEASKPGAVLKAARR
jgi:hypothetical protein